MFFIPRCHRRYTTHNSKPLNDFRWKQVVYLLLWKLNYRTPTVNKLLENIEGEDVEKKCVNHLFLKRAIIHSPTPCKVTIHQFILLPVSTLTQLLSVMTVSRYLIDSDFPIKKNNNNKKERSYSLIISFSPPIHSSRQFI